MLLRSKGVIDWLDDERSEKVAAALNNKKNLMFIKYDPLQVEVNLWLCEKK